MTPSDVKATLSFSRRQPRDRPARLQGHDRPGRDRHPQALRQDRQVHLRPGLPVDGALQLDDHLHRRRQGRAAVPRLPDRAARASNCDFLEICYLLLNGELPNAKQKDEFVEHRDPPHDGPRADARSSCAASAATRTRWRCMTGAGRRAVGLLSRLARHQQPAAPRDLGDPPDRQDADAGGDGLQVHRSASRSCTRRTTCRYAANFMRMMFAHAVRGVQAQRRAGARDGPHLHPARRPRAERLDLDGAPVRLVGRQPVRRASPPASPACGARRTAAPTRRR